MAFASSRNAWVRRIAANEGKSATAVRKRIEKGLDQLRLSCNLVGAA